MASKKKAVTEPTKNPPNPPKEIDPDIFYGLKLDREQADFANAIWCKDNDIVFCNAKAGTGKTTIATGVANMLVKFGVFNEIMYIMSPYGEKKQGWLPGDIEQKSSVYFEPFYQALINCNVNPYSAVTTDIENKKNGTAYITCITDTFLRGQNLNNAVVIIDEAQNFTVPQLKKVLTRIGDKTKVVVIGHTEQCDLDRPSLSGFQKYINHFCGEQRCSVCSLTHNHRGWISRHADELNEG